MSNAAATVVFLQGKVWAKASDGITRPLELSSVLNAGDLLVTAEGARVELDIGGIELLIINGGQEVVISREIGSQETAFPEQTLLDDTNVSQVLTILEQEVDLFDKLEETAAGNSAGGSSGGGNSFVRLTRIQDQVDSQEIVYLTPNLVDAEPPMATSENIVRAASPIEPELLVNQSPTSTDLSLSTNEDQPISNANPCK
ncbi:retention module-containing protein [Alishewanella longhuensis]